MKTKISKQKKIDRSFDQRKTKRILAAHLREKRLKDHIRNLIVEEVSIQIATGVETAFQRSVAAESIRRSIRESRKKEENNRANANVKLRTAAVSLETKSRIGRRASWLHRVARRIKLPL